MTRGGGYRPAGQLGTFSACTFGANAGQIAITYATTGFLGGWAVQYWRFGITGAPALVGGATTSTGTNVNIGVAVGGPTTVWATIIDERGELVARSAQFSL